MSLPSHDAVLGYIGQIIPLAHGLIVDYENWFLFRLEQPALPLITHRVIIGVEWFYTEQCLGVTIHRIVDDGEPDFLFSSGVLFSQLDSEFTPMLKELLHKADSQLIVEDITKQFSGF